MPKNLSPLGQPITVSVDELTTDKFIDAHHAVKCDVFIKLQDGTIRLPMQLAIFNGILWSIYRHFKLPIKKNMTFFPDRSVDKDTKKAVYSFTSDTVAKCVDKIYNELILIHKVKPHMEAVMQVWTAINRFAMFADRFTREYQVSLDALSLARLCAQKPMKEVIEREIDSSHGTKYAEQQFEKSTKDLMSVLGKQGLLKDNCLMPFMLTKLLKRNQVPQMFYAFGTRSDITDEMMKHPVSASAFSGLTGVEDFAIESLSAKKAEYFNSSVIQDAQYFARRCRLAASSMPKIHPGWCGSKVTIPWVIEPKHKYNFIGKYVKVDDQTRDLLAERKWPYQHYKDDSIELTKANIDRFLGREIQMWSPFGCRHTDGCCEHCAGYMHQRLCSYLPEGIHGGVHSVTHVVSAVTQKILSAKHLIKTSSKEYVLQPKVARYFMKNGDAIVWQPGVARGMRKCKVRIDAESLLGPLNDLTRKTLPSGVSFSRIDKLAVVKENGDVLEMLELSDETTKPYFSAYTMEYLRAHHDDIIVDANYIDIPMHEFDFNKAFLRYTAVNDDMVSFVKRVESFVMGSDKCMSVVDYTSIQSALHDFSEIIYDKTDVNIFDIEIMLRGYLVSPDSTHIPVIEDPYAPVRFAGMSQVISNAALSTKLSFEGVVDFLRSPKPTLESIGAGYGFNNCHFNFSRVQ